MTVTHDELERVAALLEKFAAESHEEAVNLDLPIDERRMWSFEAIAYETAAARLRKVALTKG